MSVLMQMVLDATQQIIYQVSVPFVILPQLVQMETLRREGHDGYLNCGTNKGGCGSCHIIITSPRN